MTTTVTDRDKKMLYILALIIVALAAYKFTITPSINKYKEAKATNNNLIEQQDKMENEIMKIDTYKKNLSVANDNYKKATEKIFGDLKPAGIDSAMTKIMIEQGLSPASLNITDINNIKINAYVVPQPVSKDNSQQTNNLGVIADEKSLVKAANVEIVATGAEDNVRALAMALSGEDGIHVQSLDLALAGAGSTLKATVSMILSGSIG